MKYHVSCLQVIHTYFGCVSLNMISSVIKVIQTNSVKLATCSIIYWFYLIMIYCWVMQNCFAEMSKVSALHLLTTRWHWQSSFRAVMSVHWSANLRDHQKSLCCVFKFKLGYWPIYRYQTFEILKCRYWYPLLVWNIQHIKWWWCLPEQFGGIKYEHFKLYMIDEDDLNALSHPLCLFLILTPTYIWLTCVSVGAQLLVCLKLLFRMPEIWRVFCHTRTTVDLITYQTHPHQCKSSCTVDLLPVSCLDTS